MKESSQSQVIALGVMVLLVSAALMIGSGALGGRPATAADADYLDAIETGADHIGPADLVDRVLAGGDGLLLVDVRPADEYAAFHLPRAVNMTVPEVVADRNRALFAAHDLVVLYSNGPAHPAQAWVELRRRGVDNVRVLDGGLEQLRAEVLTPASLRPGGTAEQAAAEAARMPLVRTFFLHAVGDDAALVWSRDPADLQAPTVVSPRWLQDRLGQVAVLDVRETAAEYETLHVPGAVYFPTRPLRKKHGDRSLWLESAETIAAALGRAGVGNDTPVVIYADQKVQDATLAALALLRAGHRRLALLEGGIRRWAAEQRPLVAGVVAPAPKEYRPVPGADDFTIDAEALHAALAEGMKVLDVRPPDFFVGDKSTEARPGHIPGSVNRPYQDDLREAPDGRYWRPESELRAEYEALGLASGDPVTVTCRTGHTASESYFVLRWLLGYENVRWYNGSWTDWAERPELPAALGAGQ